MSAAEISPANPLFRPSPLPFGLPPFGEISPEHCREALLAGMAEQRAEVATLVGSSEPPGFENTVVAMERSGRLLTRAWSVFGTLTSSVSSPRLREIEREIAPLAAAHSDALRLDPALFARIDAVHRARHDLGLDAESIRLVERYHLDFVLAGAQLDDAGRATLTGLNQELSGLTTTFGQNVQLAMEAAAVHVTDADELDGLGEEEIAAARTAAADRDLEGWLLPLLLRQRAGGRPHRHAACRAGSAAGVRHARRPGAGRPDRPHHRGGGRDARLDGPGVRGQRRGRGRRARRGRGARRRGAGALGLGVL
jgi:peptidyl-dipeptidase Dcp